MCHQKEGEYNPSIDYKNLAVFYRMVDTVRAPWVESLYFCSPSCLFQYYKESVVVDKMQFDFRFMKQQRHFKFISEDTYERLVQKTNRISVVLWSNPQRAFKLEQEANSRFNRFLDEKIGAKKIIYQPHESQVQVFSQRELERRALAPEQLPEPVVKTVPQTTTMKQTVLEERLSMPLITISLGGKQEWSSVSD